VQQGQSVSIQDRNSNTLKGDAVAARVARGGLISAYFTALTDAIVGDGNKLPLTTSRGGSTVSGYARVYVAANKVPSMYLDGTAAVQAGATVQLVNSAGTNVVGADACPVTLNSAGTGIANVAMPETVTAIADGVAHTITDGAGKTAQATASVSNGSLASQTLAGTAAIIKDGDVLDTSDGGSVTFTVSAGAIIPVYTAPASS